MSVTWRERAVLALAIALVGSSVLHAQGTNSKWPFLRGPNYDGHSGEKGLADSWSDEGPPVLWTRELGQGYSGIVAWSNRVATQFQTLGGQYVVCLSATTGERIWRYRYDWPHESAGVYPGPRATPTYADGRVYFAAPSGLIGCLDATNGRRIWSLNVKKRFAGAGTDFGYSCSPTVVDGKVILPVGGRGASMVALDARDGSVVWKNGDDPASYTPAYPITFKGQRLVLGYLQNVLVCHDVQTGERIWRRELSAGYDEHSAWPIYSEPYLWLSGPFRGGCELLELTGDRKQPLKPVWANRRMSNDIFSSVLVDGSIYGFDLLEAQAKTHRPSRGQFRCLDSMTGKEHWSTGDKRVRRSPQGTANDRGQRIGHANLIVADGKLILLNDTGELILARANSKRFEELARVSVLRGELCWTAPTLCRGRVFVRNHSRMACLYLGLPDQLDADVLATALTARDIPQSEYVDLATLILGVEPEYAFDVPSIEWLRNWFYISIAILASGLLAALTLPLLVGRRLGGAGTRRLFWASAFVLGALGTTLLSRVRHDFVFTWPVSLFVAFQIAVYQVQWKRRPATSGIDRWRPRVAGLTFVLTGAVYFLLCRRLSLVFEWVFLCGFAAAVPFAAAGALCFRTRKWRFVWESGMSVAAFAAFYWSAVAVLWWRAR